MAEDKFRTARIVSIVASTAVALSCGTNYAYSAYAPQLATRLHLSATESNLIGTFGNLGMYLSGIPAGMLVDRKGPRLALMIGSVSLFCGYYLFYLAYRAGQGGMSVAALCFFSCITGMGSCCGFNAAMKAAALNFPAHRGTATALPLSAFGLSAFFFSFLSSAIFPGDTAGFLLLLAVATSAIIFVSFFFLRVIPTPNAYSAIPSTEATRPAGNKLRRTKSSGGGSHHGRPHIEPGTNYTTITSEPPTMGQGVSAARREPTETSSILSYSSSSSSGDEEDEDYEGGEVLDVHHGADGAHHHGHHIDIRGWALTKTVDFWLLFGMLGLLTGVGLMTINNIGHSVQALWAKFDPKKTEQYVQRRQAMHVSILSLCSFTGRIIAGISSDILVRTYGASRIWLIAASGASAIIAQLCALTVSNPHFLFLVSGLGGLAYGMLFGVFPTIVSEVFGLHGMSQNWGTMTISAVVSGQMFNLFYGRIYDSHSVRTPGHPPECTLGLACYRDAYWITLCSSAMGLALALWSIRRGWRLRKEAEGADGVVEV